jgi:hypothetical protein
VETSCILSPNPMVFLVNYGYVFKDVSGNNFIEMRITSINSCTMGCGFACFGYGLFDVLMLGYSTGVVEFCNVSIKNAIVHVFAEFFN